MNILHLNILGALLDNKNTIRTELRGKREKPSGKWVQHPVDVAVPTLAGNVSNLNCDIAAKRWMP